VSYSPPPASIPRAGPAPRLRMVERLLVTFAGGVLVALLVTAACLTPNPRGMGTHRQLGLPSCTIVQWYGIRCPSCGMTTSWAHLLRGHVASAFRANAGGALLALAALVCGPWLVVSGVRGRWLIGPPRESVTLAVGLVIVAVTVIDWTMRISFGW
jgi:Protein of unknown function (DUF2752)